jgi:hypothetical protein
MSNYVIAQQSRHTRSLGERLSYSWLEIFLIAYGIWILLPWLAPVFMHIGGTGAGKAIYFIYSFFCHQLPNALLPLWREDDVFLNEIQTAGKIP